MQKEISIIDFKKEHESTLRLFCDKMGKFPFSEVLNPLVLASCSVIDSDGNIVGAGFLRAICEAITIVNPEMSKLDKGHVIDKLFLIGKARASNLGFDGIHVYTQDLESYVEVLKKRYGFVEAGHHLSLRF